MAFVRALGNGKSLTGIDSGVLRDQLDVNVVRTLPEPPSVRSPAAVSASQVHASATRAWLASSASVAAVGIRRTSRCARGPKLRANSQSSSEEKGEGAPAILAAVGDLLTLVLAAPGVVIFLVRVHAYTPDWLASLAEDEQGFVFPEFAHLLWLAACWAICGLVTGAFEKGAITSQNLARTLRRTWVTSAAASTLGLLGWAGLLLSGQLLDSYAAAGFVTKAAVQPTLVDVLVDFQVGSACLVAWRFTCAVLLADSSGGAQAPEGNSNYMSKELLLGDIVVAGVIAPCLMVLGLVLTDVYTPGWVTLWSAGGRGLAPAVLAHGALLASCWLAAALLTGAFNPGAVNPRDLAGTLKRTWGAGVAALTLLLLATFVGLSTGDSGGNLLAADFENTRRVGYALLDCLQDVIFEAIAITTWRLSYAGLL